MTLKADYNAFSDIYDLWIEGDTVWAATQQFYVDVCKHASGFIVELGVGTGRIAIEIAKTGKHIIGVDLSQAIINRCQKNAEAAGVEDKLSLMLADACEFELEQTAAMIILPFRTLGHFITLEDKRRLFENVYQQLSPGGYFIFDHYNLNKAWARTYDKVARLMYPTPQVESANIFLWDTYLYSFPTQTMKCFITAERTNEEGVVIERRYHTFSFSWIEPEQTRSILLETGFQIESLHGGFDQEVFNPSSSNQVWVALRPA